MNSFLKKGKSRKSDIYKIYLMFNYLWNYLRFFEYILDFKQEYSAYSNR